MSERGSRANHSVVIGWCFKKKSKNYARIKRLLYCEWR